MGFFIIKYITIYYGVDIAPLSASWSRRDGITVQKSHGRRVVGIRIISIRQFRI